ncbi:T9SS type A sorting domain-containing protein [Tamlana sp. I1]|uniref:T9SS type A sorting domain-containing protein n=1 Tax=Tamlana sp. I1 TaxID=2762061 RepID=UPI00188F2FF7|nr:T9SS type A sorting domain-containing protein [Tamlana sp. I1]
MNKKQLLTYFLLLSIFNIFAQDWANIPVPADAGTDKNWELQTTLSDDFNYTFNPATTKSNFGNNKWYNFYHNAWDGPGTTYWKYNHVWVDGSDLIITSSRWNQTGEDMPITNSPNKMNKPNDGISAGCITSNNKVLYPVFVEASVSVANIALASDVWLLSPDDTQEIDIIECYGGADSNNGFFAKDIHLSHHSFVRQPFQDYQPRGKNTWYTRSDITTSWGDYCWNNGARKYVEIGVNWISPVHFEYYIDGELVRVLYDKASATKKGSTWYYTYPSMTNGTLDFDSNGYQTENPFATSSSYSFSTLQNASNTSSVSIIDPYNYQNGQGFSKELDIIINVESQNWHVAAGRTPNDALLSDPSKNTMKVDWIRVYKPTSSLSTETPTQSNSIHIYPVPANQTLHIKSEQKIDDIKIYNTLGVIVYQQTTSVETIPLDQLNNGVYFISINANNKTTTKRFVVQH